MQSLSIYHVNREHTCLVRGTLAQKNAHVFLVRFSREYLIKNIFNTLHHKIIYDERDIRMKKCFILANAFINGNIMTSVFFLKRLRILRLCD